MGAVRSALRGSLLLAMVLAVLPPQALWRRLRPSGSPGPLPRAFHWIALRVLGVRVQLIGTPLAGDTALWASNHLSYLDIPVLGSLRRMRFVAKQEIESWPLFGVLAGLQRTIYIDRRRSQAHAAAGNVARAFGEGGIIVLFPEGTSSDGGAVLPFRASLLEALMAPEHRDTGVQPVTLRLLAVDGRAASELAIRDLYAYHRDMELVPHLRRFLRLRGAHLQVIFHPPLRAGDYRHRRELAARLHRDVAWGLAHGTPVARRGGP